ncbi:MAG: glycosyltransferase family 4 protein [Candidatus Eisenbacteria bacterium]
MSVPGNRATGRTGARPRLLIVGPLPPPIGGVETFTQAILESDAFGAFEVAHCDTTKGRPKSTQGRFDAGNFMWAAIHGARLTRSLARFHPDVVYLPVAGTWSGVLRDLALGWLAHRSGARVIGHQHAGDIHDVLKRVGLDEWIVRAGFARFHRLLVLGERWRAMFREYGIAIPCEVCPSTFRREVAERGAGSHRAPSPEGPLRVLYVGQIGRRKGVHDLLRSLRRLNDEGVPVSCTLVGPAQLTGETEAAHALALELGLDRLARFTGPLVGEALYREYDHADVLALPSHNEGIPVVLYEAGAFGVPVVTTPVGAIADLIRSGENGLLVPPGDVGALTAALRGLAVDAAERARLGARLRSDIAAFHPDRIAARVADAVRAELAARDTAAAGGHTGAA